MLALISGQGMLPEILAENLDQSGQSYSIFQLAGYHADNPNQRNISTFTIENLGSFLDQLVREGYTQVCFAGAIRRPTIDPDKIDAQTLPLVPKIQAAVLAGDDAALRMVTELFSERGMHIRAAQELAPALLPQAGVATRAQPSDKHAQDAERASEVLNACGKLDLGQACVVSNRQVLAIEALPGTAFMLQTLAINGPAAKLSMPAGGILYKDVKPDQDRRFDMPTIGVDTVELAAKAGLQGIVIGAGNALVLDAPKVIAACDRLGLFLWVRAAG